MVDRLNVVLVSRSGLGGKSETMIEAIVGNLAGRPGIDLVLVSPLAEINDDSTDQLTLLSIGSGAAVLTWTSPEQTMSDLDRIGFTGDRSPHAGDPFTLPKGAGHSASVTRRKVYAMDLRDLSAVDDLIAQLDRLRVVGSVKTVSLGGLAASSMRSDRPAVQSPSVHPPAPPTVVTKSATSLPTQPRQHTAAQVSKNHVSKNQANKNRPPPSGDDAGLDDLIDQLDDFDV